MLLSNRKNRRIVYSNKCKDTGTMQCFTNLVMMKMMIVSLLLIDQPVSLFVTSYLPDSLYVAIRRHPNHSVQQQQQQWESSYSPFRQLSFFMATTNSNSKSSSSSSSSSTTTTNEPDFTSNDPYRILGIQRNNIFVRIDEKELKRIYRRLAMKYHPDIVTTKDSPNEEKKIASDRFAKINTAYDTLLNKSSTGIGSNTQTKSTSSSSSSGWEPPHRRTRSYSTTTSDNTSTSSTSTSNSNKDDTNNPFSSDWRDYIPKPPDDNEIYDTGGDSFGKIFADLLQQGASTVVGATAAAAGSSSTGGGIFKDFIDFLEQNVDGYRNNNDNDADLRILLQVGTKQEIADEMDETELVVRQLSNKLQKVQEEIIQIQNDLTAVPNRRYSETLEYQERLEEIQAQKNIVENYIKRARNRLSKIQTRYKELLVYGDNDSGGNNSNLYNNNDYNPASSTQSVYNKPSQQSSTPYSSSTTTTTTINDRSSSVGNNDNPNSATDSNQGWKDQGFGSFTSRSRGSSRRRPSSSSSSSSPPPQSPSAGSSSSNNRSTNDNTAYSTKTTSQSSSSSSTATNTSSNQSQPSSSSSTKTTTKIQDPLLNNQVDESTTGTYVPPHRRTGTGTTNNSKSFTQRIEQDKQRLREIKVDEAFDQLKRDLGL
jgi:curved DNA-binding protein CbpA